MDTFTFDYSSLMNAVNNNTKTQNTSLSPPSGGDFIPMPNSIIQNPLYDPFGPCWGNQW